MADKPPDFDAIAGELYVLAPQGFTAARNDRADKLKETDPQLAKQVRALRRPTLAAWAANILTHRHHDLVGRLLELGQALRDAQEHLAGEQLRVLAEQRRELVRALTGQAERDAAAAGHPLGAEAVAGLDRTLSAALADPDAARALAEGRLTAALEPPIWPVAPAEVETGQGAGATTDGPRRAAGRRAPGTAAKPGKQERSTDRAEADRRHRRERDQAREAVAAAKRTEREAARHAAEAEQALRDARSARRRAGDEVERARAALARAREHEADAQEDLAQAGEQVRAAEDAARTAHDQASRAGEAVQQAAARLRELEAAGRGG
ncbi:hypothetical protein F7Q99_32705 [Streptomyces kaniharaensis]|uniref:Uncharacterized protein n=1 Tax=Streptomyces kaniharaensis TaxID=212423 RepID=A0A6N7KYW1_9ACTN|nr:hypothetical protein [Streptomyces kaniharaensis]MQS16822.1 hypothetical protein [Streptomyces kaniharaensis]